MVVKKSLSFDDELWAAMETEAGKEGVAVSKAFGKAAELWLSVRHGLAAVTEWEAEHGPLGAEELAEADALLDTAGVTAADYSARRSA